MSSTQENDYVRDIVLQATGASGIASSHEIQALWSDCGYVSRLFLHNNSNGSSNSSKKRGKKKTMKPSVVVVKSIRLAREHLEGKQIKPARVALSYNAEAAFYRWIAAGSKDGAVALLPRLPRPLAVHQEGPRTVLVLEDLSDAGFPGRSGGGRSLPPRALHACVCWLSRLHAAGLGLDATKVELWPQGNYWHLSTRPEELQALRRLHPALHAAAARIDQALRNCPYQTLVHGDPKVANFCFSEDFASVAAVDFQYVGNGVGVSDVAYLMHSCLDDRECEEQHEALLDVYFAELRVALQERKHPTSAIDAVEECWRALFPVAVTDFTRFYIGWTGVASNKHFPQAFPERLSRKVLKDLMK